MLISASPPFAAIDRGWFFSRVRFFLSLSKWLRDALCVVKRTFLRIEGVSNLNLVGREGENINRWCFNRGALYRWKSGLRGRRTNGEKEKPKQNRRDIRARMPERGRGEENKRSWMVTALGGRIVNDCRLKYPSCGQDHGRPSGSIDEWFAKSAFVAKYSLANFARESYSAICSLLVLPWTAWKKWKKQEKKK